MNNPYIRNIQKRLIYIYMCISEICDKYDWKLFLAGGSMLGAVRHNGFIPWDDDMDFAMPRHEYEQFIQIAQKELPECIRLKWKRRGHFLMIYDERYEIALNKTGTEAFGGKGYVHVDLMPIDGMPNNKFIRIIHSFRVLAYRVCFKLADSSKIYQALWRPKWQNILIGIIHKIPSPFHNEQKWENKWDKVMKKYKYEECNWVGILCGKYHLRDIYPKEWWGEGTIAEFEGLNVRIAKEYDKYLTQIYGNYRVLPEEGKRFVHCDIEKAKM